MGAGCLVSPWSKHPCALDAVASGPVAGTVTCRCLPHLQLRPSRLPLPAVRAPTGSDVGAGEACALTLTYRRHVAQGPPAPRPQLTQLGFVFAAT